MDGRLLQALAIVVFSSLLGANCQEDHPIVNTTYGAIRGSRLLNKYNETYEQFVGIPYATPPVGDLRWRNPLPPDPWEGVQNATEYSAHCIQFIAPLYALLGLGREDSEDCLYLNIFVPNGVEYATQNQLPVMVFIHGGGYFLGTAEMYPGQDLALTADVIVVNFNYRVSTLGWLATGDDAARGNYGLWDTKAALTWVQENIENFGGDKEQVTLFGQSAGAGMTSHAVLSPETSPLFIRAISLSGAAADPYSPYREKYLQCAQTLATYFNCTTEDTQEMVDCLRLQDASALDLDGFRVLTNAGLPLWAPVIDGQFVFQDPATSWRQGYGSDKDFITGRTLHDSAGFVMNNVLGFPPDFYNYTDPAETLNSTYEYLHDDVSFANNSQELVQVIVENYPDLASEDATERLIALTLRETDEAFGSESQWEASRHAEADGVGRTYVYEFRHPQSFLGYPSWVNGSHLDDIYSILGETFMQVYRIILLRKEFSEEDKSISQQIMTYLGNFAHTGDPNSDELLPWPEYDTVDRRFLVQLPTMAVESESPELTALYDFWTDGFWRLVEWPEDEVKPTTAKFSRDVREIMNMLVNLNDGPLADLCNGGMCD